MAVKEQWLCVYAMVIYLSLFLIGFFVIAKFVPPPQPSASEDQIARLYQDNTFGIRLGIVLTMVAAGFQIPRGALVSAQMRRIRGNPKLLAGIQFVCNAL